MKKQHQYNLTLEWTGNTGAGTCSYATYERSYTISAAYKKEISGSSDPSFRGDKTKYNPEELLVASITSCHMLWYLHLCAEAGVIVTNYTDKVVGMMHETENGSGYFSEITLYPKVTVKDVSMIEKANSLHSKAK